MYTSDDLLGLSSVSKNNDEKRILKSIQLLNESGEPNLHPLALSHRTNSPLALNVKSMGYQLARSISSELEYQPKYRPKKIGLESKPTTQADLESEWAGYWCNELRIKRVMHRKIWEYVYLLQGFFENDCLRPGNRAIGFGCGQEPIPSYLSSCGINVVATDLGVEESKKLGWISSQQHASQLEQLHIAEIVEADVFNKHVSLQYVDMNSIPDSFSDFDMCWSICALEHLGSISNGLNFIVNSLKTLKPGGIAIHTTEFNFLDQPEILDNWPTVLYKRHHFESLRDELVSSGHCVASMSFDVGDKPMDRFIDLPPWPHDYTPALAGFMGEDSFHLKLDIDGFASTCYGLIIKKCL